MSGQASSYPSRNLLVHILLIFGWGIVRANSLQANVGSMGAASSRHKASHVLLVVGPRGESSFVSEKDTNPRLTLSGEELSNKSDPITRSKIPYRPS